MGCTYTIKDSDGNDVVFTSVKALASYVRTNNFLGNNAQIQEASNTTDHLAAVLRQETFGENNFSPDQLYKFQENLLDTFIGLETESQYFYKLGPIIALTKGLGKNFDTIELVKNNLKDLFELDSEGKLKSPIDVRYLLTGDPMYKAENIDQYHHEITSNNIKIMREIDSLSKTMFLKRTPIFQFSSDRVKNNLKPNLSGDEVREMRNEFSAFIQVAAYKRWLIAHKKSSPTLRNSLIYEMGTNEESIIDIVRKAQQATQGQNAFLNFILPVPTTVKVKGQKIRNINNKDLINTIEGKTRGKIEPDLIASLMDSFSELYSDPRTRSYAKALFDYLIIKDGLMFKNKSFIKMLPTEMFKEFSDATTIATEVLAANSLDEFRAIIKKLAQIKIVDPITGVEEDYFKDEDMQKYSFKELFTQKNLQGISDAVYDKVFGVTSKWLYHNFEKIYATDLRYQFNLQYVKPTLGNTRKNIEAITFDENRQFMTVKLFPPEFHETEKGSDARKEYMKKNEQELTNAGFEVVKIGEDRKYILYKKYIRVPSNSKDVNGRFVTHTFKLSSVDRDKTTYYNADVTVDGEYVPRGTSAVYERVEAVGMANATGVADVGPRPTKDQLIAVIDAKLRKEAGVEQKPTPQASSPTSANVVKTPLVGFTNHSGGAIGADSEWDNIGKEFGMINNNHYWHGKKNPKSQDKDQISEEIFKEGVQKVGLANKALKRQPANYMNLLARNWAQVKFSDAIFAVSTLANSKEVSGGTGWAVQMAVDAGKPVYVFDQNRNAWFTAQYTQDMFGNKTFVSFVETITPVLTKNFAGIGTRELNDNGRKAIRNVYTKTASNLGGSSSASDVAPVEPTPAPTTPVQGFAGFGGLAQLPFDPRTDAPFQAFTDHEIDEQPDNCI